MKQNIQWNPIFFRRIYKIEEQASWAKNMAIKDG